MLGNQPPIPMRKMLLTQSKNRIMFSLFASAAGGIAFYMFYLEPRYNNYVKFYDNYDPYEHMREICAYPIKYLHTCPSNLVQLLEKKGYRVAELDEAAKTFEGQGKPKSASSNSTA